jgi:hypothetical protein
VFRWFVGILLALGACAGLAQNLDTGWRMQLMRERMIRQQSEQMWRFQQMRQRIDQQQQTLRWRHQAALDNALRRELRTLERYDSAARNFWSRSYETHARRQLGRDTLWVASKTIHAYIEARDFLSTAKLVREIGTLGTRALDLRRDLTEMSRASQAVRDAAWENRTWRSGEFHDLTRRQRLIAEEAAAIRRAHESSGRAAQQLRHTAWEVLKDLAQDRAKEEAKRKWPFLAGKYERVQTDRFTDQVEYRFRLIRGNETIQGMRAVQRTLEFRSPRFTGPPAMLQTIKIHDRYRYTRVPGRSY